jgi:hypothetical protein
LPPFKCWTSLTVGGRTLQQAEKHTYELMK